MFFVIALSFPTGAYAWKPNTKHLGAAISKGDFKQYFQNASEWLNQRMHAEASGISKAGLKALLKDPAFANTLSQRQLISKVGVKKMADFARCDQKNQAFLAWVLRDTEAMDLCLMGATPVGVNRRKRNNWKIRPSSLKKWNRIFHADPQSKEGICLKLAIAVGLNPPGTCGRGVGQAKNAPDPLARYKHFKKAYKNQELFPSFENHTVWEYGLIVSSGASNADLSWAREMINTWRPDLRVNEQVVKSTSEVQYRDPPISFDHTYKNVLVGGGKCGPRASWAGFICRAFGVPVVGVRQPGHVCAAYKAVNPKVEPQPGKVWKVVYGRGWNHSRTRRVSGPEFLKEMKLRSHDKAFFIVEHLRWIASAVKPEEKKVVVIGISNKIEESALSSGWAGRTKAEKHAGAAVASQRKVKEEPFSPAPGVIHIEAESFSKQTGVQVHNCFTGGKQVYLPTIGQDWGNAPRIDYIVNVPKAGVYDLTLRIAAPRDEVIEMSSGGEKIAAVKTSKTYGLWETASPVKVRLQKGKQTLTLTCPRPHRGIALRWLEFKSKKGGVSGALSRSP